MYNPKLTRVKIPITKIKYFNFLFREEIPLKMLFLVVWFLGSFTKNKGTKEKKETDAAIRIIVLNSNPNFQNKNTLFFPWKKNLLFSLGTRQAHSPPFSHLREKASDFIYLAKNG